MEQSIVFIYFRQLCVEAFALPVASPIAPFLLVSPWRLDHLGRHVVGDAATSSFGSTILVDRSSMESRSLSELLECESTCGA